MLVVAPKDSKVGYFKHNDILCFAEIDMETRKLDTATVQVVDFFDDTADWQEALTALELIE